MSYNPFEHLDPVFGEKKIRNKKKYTWIESALDIEETEHQHLTTSHTKLYVGTIITRQKIRWFFVIVGCGLLLIMSRIFYLQIFQGTELSLQAENNRIRVLPILSERGIIYDREGKQLVENVPNFYISIIPQDLPSASREPQKRAEIIKRISELAQISPEQVEKLEYKLDPQNRKRASPYQSLVIKENLDYKTALQIYLENSDLPGIVVETGFKRHYLTSTSSLFSASSTLQSLSPILGYTGKITDADWTELKNSNYLLNDNLGKEGVEKEYEQELRGVYGKRNIEVDASDHEQNIISVEQPLPGKNLKLSIDVEAQAKLEQLLSNEITKIDKQRGAAIALNPQTGEILALVNYPSYDNNDFSGGISVENYKKYTSDPSHPLFNRAIAGGLPPGSTFKPVVAAAALEEHTITPQTSINSTGGIRIGLSFFPDWKAGGHGITNVTKALAWSVNTFFFAVGGGYQEIKGLGLERIQKYMTFFGLGKITGIDLPGETGGSIPSEEKKKARTGEPWYLGDTYNISIGQGDTLVTPLQMAVWTAAFANGGKLIVPHVVDSIIDPQTQKSQ
jgi:penicillin-binding protein 2